MAALVETDAFRLDRLPGDVPRSRLFSEGQTTGATVDGWTLEAQFRWDDALLLLTTDDSPYEEALHIRLFDQAFHEIDAVDLRQIYHSAIVRNVKVMDDNSLTFSFFGDDTWRLNIDAHAKLRWDMQPFASIHYPGGRLRRHYLSLTRDT